MLVCVCKCVGVKEIKFKKNMYSSVREYILLESRNKM